MLRPTRLPHPNLLALLAGFSLLACGSDGGEPDDNSVDTSVQARRLSDGQLELFAAEDLVPAGWIPCKDDSCPIPPEVPCQNIGPTACVLQPECNLRTLACWQEGGFVEPLTGLKTQAYLEDDAVDMDSVANSDEASTDPAIESVAPSLGGGQRCVVTCEHKGHKECADLSDPRSCQANAQCEWQELPICMMPCTVEGCPPCTEPKGVCRDKAPEPRPCVELDQRQCLRRDDCEWSPIFYYDCADGQSCSQAGSTGIENGSEAAAAGEDSTADPRVVDLVWRPQCQPRRPEPVCAPIPARYPVCEGGGEPTPRYDDAGCLIGYECPVVPVCKPVPMLYPRCESGEPTPKYDDAGCLIGYECPVVPVCPLRPVPYPICEGGGEPTPRYDDAGCLIRYECPMIPTCTGSTRDECLARSPGCLWDIVGTCRTYCTEGVACEPCQIGECIPAPTQVCQKVTSADSCEQVVGCRWAKVEESIACTRACLLDGSGGCQPCDPMTVIVERCVGNAWTGGLL